MTGFPILRARRALREAGFDHRTPLVAASSVTNEVWLAGDFVVRVNTRPDHRLRREVLLAEALPAALGYPPVVAYGDDHSGEWLILRRIPGQPLARAWPDLTPDERRCAIGQLAERLALVHATEAPPIAGLDDRPHLLTSAATPGQAVERLRSGVATAKRLDRVDPAMMHDLDELIVRCTPALDPFDATTLVHGDLTFENVLWDGHRVTALLDFEWARAGPPDLDLDVLLRFAAYPSLHVAPDYEHRTHAIDYADVAGWLLEASPALFDHPRQFERLQLFSIAWDVDELLRFPPKVAPRHLHPDHPYHRLQRTLDGVSHLDRLERSSVA